jgi:hypothetical protein
LGSELFETIKRGMSLGFGWTYTTSGRAVITMIIPCFRVVSGGEGCHDCLFQGGLLSGCSRGAVEWQAVSLAITRSDLRV